MITARQSSNGAFVELAAPSSELHALASQIRVILDGSSRVRILDGAVRIPIADAITLLERPELPVDWNSDIRQFVENRNRTWSTDDIQLSRELLVEPIEIVTARLQGSRLLPMLDDHQIRNVATMTLPNSLGTCLFDEQGTGKTISVVAAFDLLVERNEVDALLVVAPKSMVGEWGSEMSKFAGDAYRVETLDGTRQQRAACLSTGADVFVCNYETILSIPDDLRLLCKGRRVLIAADESFAVKNPLAVRTAALTQLREWCVRAYVLCGTPAPNDSSDVISQVSFVDLGRAFSGVHLDPDDDKKRSQIRTTLEEKVVYTRNLKGAVLPELPGRTFTETQVTLAGQQLDLYRSIGGGLASDLTNATDAEFKSQYTNFLARRAALIRVCSDPSGVAPGFSETPAKLSALDDLIDHYMKSGEKVVLWSFYRSTLNALEQRYRHHGVARVDGSVTGIDQRRAAVRGFQEDPEVRMFLGNPAAAGAGITLHSAAVAIYESMSNQAAHYLQSLDRIHRRGQNREVEYVTLLCQGTIEENEYARLHHKAAMQADLLGDPEPTHTSRTMMLDELLTSLDRIGGQE